MTTRLYLFKAVNGDDIIATLENESDTSYFLQKPMIMRYFTDEETGRESLAMLRYAPGSLHDSFEALKTSFIGKIELDAQMLSYYEKSVRYAEKFMDAKWSQAIKDASRGIDKATGVESSVKSSTDNVDFVFSSSPSKVKH